MAILRAFLLLLLNATPDASPAWLVRLGVLGDAGSSGQVTTPSPPCHVLSSPIRRRLLLARPHQPWSSAASSSPGPANRAFDAARATVVGTEAHAAGCSSMILPAAQPLQGWRFQLPRTCGGKSLLVAQGGQRGQRDVGISGKMQTVGHVSVSKVPNMTCR
jgi:hypothetical protein